MSSPFAPRSGCPMCGIVSFASTSGSILSTTPSDVRPLFKPGASSRAKAKDARPDILYRDDNFTVYEERDYAVSSLGHLVVCFNLHVPSIYALSSSDVPLLIKLQEVSTRLLSYFTTSPNASPAPSPALAPQNTLPTSASHSRLPPHSPVSPSTPTQGSTAAAALNQYSATPPYLSGHTAHIGFITPPFKDPKIPVGDHLHAHAYIGDLDRIKWYDVARKVVYNMGWWDVADLIAEIREQTSNNRVKSGGAYTAPRILNPPSSTSSTLRPIAQVPHAGAREGRPNGIETTAPSLGIKDLEAGEGYEEDDISVVGRSTYEDREALQREWEEVTTPTASGSGTSYAPRPTRVKPELVIEMADQSGSGSGTVAVGGTRSGSIELPRSPAPLLSSVDDHSEEPSGSGSSGRELAEPDEGSGQDLTEGERPISALSL